MITWEEFKKLKLGDILIEDRFIKNKYTIISIKEGAISLESNTERSRLTLSKGVAMNRFSVYHRYKPKQINLANCKPGGYEGAYIVFDQVDNRTDWQASAQFIGTVLKVTGIFKEPEYGDGLRISFTGHKYNSIFANPTSQCICLFHLATEEEILQSQFKDEYLKGSSKNYASSRSISRSNYTRFDPKEHEYSREYLNSVKSTLSQHTETKNPCCEIEFKSWQSKEESDPDLINLKDCEDGEYQDKYILFSTVEGKDFGITDICKVQNISKYWSIVEMKFQLESGEIRAISSDNIKGDTEFMLASEKDILNSQWKDVYLSECQETNKDVSSGISVKLDHDPRFKKFFEKEKEEELIIYVRDESETKSKENKVDLEIIPEYKIINLI